MKRIPQIFTQIDNGQVPVGNQTLALLNDIEQGLIEESLREYIREFLLKENKLSGHTIEGILSLLDGYASNTWIFFDTETTD